METQALVYHPIGMIHSLFWDIADMPIQSAGAGGSGVSFSGAVRTALQQP